MNIPLFIATGINTDILRGSGGNNEPPKEDPPTWVMVVAIIVIMICIFLFGVFVGVEYL